MLILVTGATAQVGRSVIARLLDDARFAQARIRAPCHNRVIEATDRIEVIKRSIADRDVAVAAVAGATHVIHLATCKEISEDVMDVTVKGLFWLLEASRTSDAARQFILIGGDAGVGHFFYRHDGPITENTPRMAYRGCYALSKVLEEVLLEQCAPWIMEKDDFRYTLSDDLFGGPDWKTMVPAEDARRYEADGRVPLLRDADGCPLKRNFAHVHDLVSAILAAIDNPRARHQLFNICMDEPDDYGAVAAHLARTRKFDSVDIPSSCHSNWMDNSKAKYLLECEPKYDLGMLIDSAWRYERPRSDPRVAWYPG